MAALLTRRQRACLAAISSTCMLDATKTFAHAVGTMAPRAKGGRKAATPAPLARGHVLIGFSMVARLTRSLHALQRPWFRADS